VLSIRYRILTPGGATEQRYFALCPVVTLFTVNYVSTFSRVLTYACFYQPFSQDALLSPDLAVGFFMPVLRGCTGRPPFFDFHQASQRKPPYNVASASAGEQRRDARLGSAQD